MTDITPNHPAVEAALLVVYGHRDETCAPEIADAINAALPHLTSATPENLARLRDTPVGRALMAEGWEEGILDHMGQRLGTMSPEVISTIRERIASDNPYREDS